MIGEREEYYWLSGGDEIGLKMGLEVAEGSIKVCKGVFDDGEDDVDG